MEETTRDSIERLATDRPDWLLVLRAAAKRAKLAEPYGGRFAGRWVLEDLKNDLGKPAWVPGLRVLVAYGLLEKVGETVRGGKRAYYRMPDRVGVEEVLSEIEARGAFPKEPPPLPMLR